MPVKQKVANIATGSGKSGDAWHCGQTANTGSNNNNNYNVERQQQ